MVEDAEIAAATDCGAWRMLCVRVLEAAVQDLSRFYRNARRTSELARQTGNRAMLRRLEEEQRHAERWFLDPTTGTVTFAQVCDALDKDIEVARERIFSYALSGADRGVRMREASNTPC